MTTLGSSGLEVFPLVLGTNNFGWTSSPEESHRILDAFVAGGGNFLDTADVYSAWVTGHRGGESESVIGDWLAARRNRADVLVATKGSAHPEFTGLRPETITAAAEQSLRRLRTDHIDVYYAHYDDPDVPLEDVVHAFHALTVRGLVRHVALSNYTPDRVQAWLDTAAKLDVPLPVAIQPHYNLLERTPFENELRPIAEKSGMGVLPYYGLAAGFLTGKYRSAEDTKESERLSMMSAYVNDAGFAVVDELVAVAAEVGAQPGTVALAWLRTQPDVTAPIAGASSVAQVEGLLASTTLELTDQHRQRLDRASDLFASL
jgi:aryl-alcohol dehydrogenase-like predicted oxidoreductase